MKKDGILETMKNSRLKIVADDSKTEPAVKKSKTEPTETGKSTEEMPRNVVEARTSKATAGTGVRGVPKSGRVWKRIRSERFSKIRCDKPDRTSWQHKVDKKNDEAAIRSLTQQLKEEKLEREKAERERIAESRKRKLENEKKNEVVVPIKNMAKLKRMRKKQLRTIQKR